jgi:hypothetical protein
VLPYRTDGQFVEISLGARYETTELRTLFETIRDDPRVPDGALLLFDASSRTQVMSEHLARARLEMYLDILRGRAAPAFAAIVSSASALSGQTVQREAAAAGVRVALFLDSQSARRWLSSCAAMPEGL